MELLKQHGFYEGGLINVDSPLLVKHYNNCLTAIGQNPTGLSRFRIDGRGWSPEVATEKQNDAYLSHGGAVQYAILLSPDQRGKPIYKSYFSFERALLASIFLQAKEAIARITKSTGLWLQITPGFSEIKQLKDLAMVRNMTVNLGDPDNLVKTSEQQQQLAENFIEDKDSWMNEELRQNISALGQKFGDLRFNRTFKPFYEYNETTSFYTSAFGGSFVFRRKGSKGILVLEKEEKETKDKCGLRVSFLKKRSLLSHLMSMGLIEIPIEWYRENLKTLRQLREEMLADAVYLKSDSVDFLNLNEAQKDSLIMEHKKDLPQEFASLERLEQRLYSRETIDAQKLQLSLKWLLARPVEGLPVQISETVFKLISRATKVLLTTQYAYDKERFFEAYGSWPEARQKWVVETLLKSGIVPRRHT